MPVRFAAVSAGAQITLVAWALLGDAYRGYASGRARLIQRLW